MTRLFQRIPTAAITAAIAAAALCVPLKCLGAPIPRADGAPVDTVPTELIVPARHSIGPFMTKRKLTVPPGFTVTLWAAGLGKVRMLAEDKDGAILASVPSEGKILKLADRAKNGSADEITAWADGLNKPHGIAVIGDSVFVAETGALILLKDEKNNGRADSKTVISTDIPEGGGHWTRTVAAGPDGKLYLSAGSSCNVCVEKDQRRAAITRFPIDGGKGELYATGLRNSVGIAFDPKTGELWGVDNGSDWRGEDQPPEELNRITKGADYGWPYCYGDRLPDPDFKTPDADNKTRCAATTPPEVKMQAHSAPLGLAFGYGLDFPAPYRDMLFITFHGSWNRIVPTGYKVVAVPFKNGRPAGAPLDFVTGWRNEEGVWGRPVGLLAARDGALYLSDDHAGAIYKITAPNKGDKR